MVDLKDAYVIGQDNLTAWSNGFDKQGYLKVLPHPDQKIAFGDPYVDWQKDHQDGNYKDKGITGNYYSSWSPDRTLEVTLNMDELLQGFNIPGLGLVKPGNGYIEWLNKATPYDTIYTGSGRDTFKLDKGTGEATIYGFGVSDMISLGSGFKFNDITISQVGGDTQLRVTNSNDLLATLKWVQSDTITNTTFA